MATLKEQLQSLTDESLRDIGRNESAPIESRLAAVELLLGRLSRLAQHPDLAPLVGQIATETTEAVGEALDTVEGWTNG